MEKGTKVIVRSAVGDVYFGTLKEWQGGTATLTSSRLVYRWQIDYVTHGTSQVTCNELARFGPFGNSVLAVPVSAVDVCNVAEVIACTDAAAAAIEGWPT